MEKRSHGLHVKKGGISCNNDPAKVARLGAISVRYYLVLAGIPG
jgi:hypothetical protein